MSTKNFIKLPNTRGFITLPSIIFEDNRVSIGAKGLYAQLYYSNNQISSLDDLINVTSSTKEEIHDWFNELNNVGYLNIKDSVCTMVIKPQTEKTVAKKLDKEAVKTFIETNHEPEKTLNAYDKMVRLIKSFKFDPKVENLLITYFEKWLNRRGRFSEAETLHGYMVRAKINDLIAFKMCDEDMIKSIQQSIDKEWFKFVDPRIGNSSFIAFDKTTLTSGSYTEEDIKNIKERAELLNNTGKKGIF